MYCSREYQLTSRSHVMFGHMKMANILANHISRLKSMELYDFLQLEKHGQEIVHAPFKPIPLMEVNEMLSVKCDSPLTGEMVSRGLEILQEV